jgi:hypothetical protein
MADRKSKKIGALWLKQAVKDGKKIGYMTGMIDLGALGEMQIVVLKNTHKEKENQPDYNIVLSEPRGQERQSGDETPDDDSILF